MEAVGFAASLITLIEAIAILTKTSTKLCRSFQDAPHELEALNARLLLLQTELEALRSLSIPDFNNALPTSLRTSLLSMLDMGYEAMMEILTVCKKSCYKTGIRGKLRWSFLDQSQVTRHLERVRSVEGGLSIVLHILNTNGQANILAEVQSIKSYFKQRRDTSTVNVPCPPIRKRHGYEANRFWSTYSSGDLLRALGVSGSVVCSSSRQSTMYSVSIRTRIPFASIFGDNELTMNFSLKSFALCRSISIQDNSTLAVRTIVPDDSEVMVACANGDLKQVMELFANGKARPDDTTSSNSSPLRYAIESGNVELVRFLIDNGSNVNGSFGSYQTSPLSWALQQKQYDIVRLFLQYGANLDHVGSISWTPLFYCWPHLSPSKASVAHLVSTMADFDHLDVDIRDKWGWGVIHRAASYGTAEDIRILIDLGASIDASVSPLGWNAIFHAVFYGNLDTFLALLSYYSSLIVCAIDERGWTLLHIAASAGHDQIVRHLLSLGSDVYALSKPFMSHMPESLFNRRCTPEEVAEAQSKERKSLFLRAVEQSGQIESKSADVNITMEEVFHDADEGLI